MGLLGVRKPTSRGKETITPPGAGPGNNFWNSSGNNFWNRHRLHQISKGDREAWETLVRELSGSLYQVAYAVLRSPEEAEDVVQETWIQVRFNAGKFTPAGANDDAGACRWLRRLTVNCAIKWRRQEVRRSQRELRYGPEPSASADPGLKIEIKEQNESLCQLMGILNASDREVILLHYLDGQDHQTLAKTLNCGPATARKRLQRAMERIRKEATIRRLVPALTLLAMWTDLDAKELPGDLTRRILANAKHGKPVLSSYTLYGGMSLMTKVSLIAAAALFVTVGTSTFILAQENPSPVTAETTKTTKVKIESTVNATPLSATIPTVDVDLDALIPKNAKESFRKSLFQELDLNFEESTLSEICMFLSFHSSVPVKVDPSCEEKLITIKYSKRTITQVLNDIAFLSDCTLKITDQEIVFQPKQVAEKDPPVN